MGADERAAAERTAVAEYVGREGFNVFDFTGVAEEEWGRRNAQLLNSAMRRGDEIRLVTDPALHEAYLKELGIPLTKSYYLSLELPMLEQYGAAVVRGY